MMGGIAIDTGLVFASILGMSIVGHRRSLGLKPEN